MFIDLPTRRRRTSDTQCGERQLLCVPVHPTRNGGVPRGPQCICVKTRLGIGSKYPECLTGCHASFTLSERAADCYQPHVSASRIYGSTPAVHAFKLARAKQGLDRANRSIDSRMVSKRSSCHPSPSPSLRRRKRGRRSHGLENAERRNDGH